MSVLLKKITNVDGEITAFARVGAGSYLVSVGGGSTLTVSTITNVASAAVLAQTPLSGFSAQSVAVFGDLVAVALQPTSSGVAPGTVRFYRIATDGSLAFLKDQAVGVLPDSLAFSADGSKLVVANEGQPNDTYSVDPLGSISVINVADAGGSNLGLDAALLDFTGFTPPPSGVVDGTALRFSSSVPSGTTFAQDLEPEAIAISGNRAYVTLQENNGVAVVDLATRTIIQLLPLGAVNYSDQFVDLTDNSSTAPSFGNRFTPGSDILGLRMPDGIASFVANGQTFFLTANEGDGRTDYGATFNDEFAPPVNNVPDVSTIRNGIAPGGTASSTAFGSRSLSLFSASGELIWDSGVQLQSSAIGAGVYADNRSDAKGVEPEMVTLGRLNGRTYAFVGLERTANSMVSVFDVSDPSAVDFVTSVVLPGSFRPEGLLFIDPASSPSGQALLVVANEGTTPVNATIDILDAGALVAQDADRNPAGTYSTSMLRDGDVDLSFKSLFTVGESTRLLEAGDKWNGQNRAALNKDDKTNRGQAPQVQPEASYVPPGILDGLGAFDNGDGTYTVLANHELGSTAGYGYALEDFAAGEELQGARISRFIVDKDIDDDASNGYQSKVLAGGLAYERIFDASGKLVTAADQLGGGLSRFCSSTYLEARSFGKGRGFSDDIYLTGEETSEGLMYALDVKTAELHAVPALGRAGWENATLIDTGNSKTVALLLADDNTAGLLLWVGTKGGNGFLAQNGMDTSSGSLYTWKPAAGGIGSAAGTSGIPDSADLAATAIGSSQAGSWVKVGNGSEVASWSEDQLKAKVIDVGGLQLSRIEDIHTNPLNGRQAVVATTGNSDFDAADRYGNLLTLDFSGAFDRKGLLAASNTTSLRVIYDGDKGLTPQAGIRNPDNLTWSADGFIYAQEDRAVPGGIGGGQFGSVEASIWKLDPRATIDPITNPQGVAAQRWAVIDPSTAPAAYGQTNLSPSINPANVGNWESSGIIDVSSLYGSAAGSFFLGDVQAHSLRDGNLGGASYLTEGGQLTLIGTPGLAFG
ncbi:choice-of-anchor I family protein [Synechococcus sp. RedBA-s]|uniref:choice-of-anchor I family protein n=1 Tax=Synechococcus sp. RedBA-s TaxID=2823741 RepID=UPI0020CF0F6E|nr:choice-of-anchor I family protein [Synechococcus sp. RedBA-s]MCP9801699.1 choice-of-anchor I family protein [Synechococcus sp. RedBA-s]